MEEKERNSSAQEKIEFIRENYKNQTYRDDFRNGSITGSIYEALMSVFEALIMLDHELGLVELELIELKRELNL